MSNVRPVTPQSLGYPPRLKRGLSTLDVVIYGLIYMVPMAPVAVFGFIYDLSAGMVALVYLVAAIAMTFSALSYGEMAKRYPVAGSVYSYVRFGLNPYIGYLAGWAILLDYLLLPALLSVFAAIATANLWPAVPAAFWVVVYILAATLINLHGITLTATLNRIFLVIQLVTLGLFLSLIAHDLLTGRISLTLQPFYNAQAFSWPLLFSALPIALLSFLGLDAMATVNEETRGGGQAVSSATLIALASIALLFIVQVYAASLYGPAGPGYGSNADDAFYRVASQIGGEPLRQLMALVSALIAIFANSIVSQAASSRLVFSMARDRELPNFLARVGKHQTPTRAILLIAVLSLGVALMGNLYPKELVAVVTFGALVAYILLHLSVIACCLVRGRSKRYLLHGASPVLGMAVLSYALWHTADVAKYIGVGWLTVGALIGLVQHFRTSRSKIARSVPNS